MANLDTLRRDLAAKVDRVADIVAKEVERELKGDAPVDTGELRRLISASVTTSSAGATIDFRSSATYASYVHEHRAEWDATMRTIPDRIRNAWHRVP